MTDQEIIDHLMKSATYASGMDLTKMGTLFRAAAERIRVLGEEVEAAKTFIDWTADPDHERGRDNGFDEWEAARAATDAARRG